METPAAIPAWGKRAPPPVASSHDFTFTFTSHVHVCSKNQMMKFSVQYYLHSCANVLIISPIHRNKRQGRFSSAQFVYHPKAHGHHLFSSKPIKLLLLVEAECLRHALPQLRHRRYPTKPTAPSRLLVILDGVNRIAMRLAITRFMHGQERVKRDIFFRLEFCLRNDGATRSIIRHEFCFPNQRARIWYASPWTT